MEAVKFCCDAYGLPAATHSSQGLRTGSSSRLTWAKNPFQSRGVKCRCADAVICLSRCSCLLCLRCCKYFTSYIYSFQSVLSRRHLIVILTPSMNDDNTCKSFPIFKLLPIPHVSKRFLSHIFNHDTTTTVDSTSMHETLPVKRSWLFKNSANLDQTPCNIRATQILSFLTVFSSLKKNNSVIIYIVLPSLKSLTLYVCFCIYYSWLCILSHFEDNKLYLKIFC